ncbi:mpv17-like protein 2 [Cochliomyia hominivorax]
MFSRRTLNYTTLIRNYSQYHKTKKCILYQLGTRHPLLKSTATKTFKPPTPINFQLSIYRIKHNSSKNVNKSSSSLPSNTANSSKLAAIKQLWNDIFGKYLLITNIVGSGILMVFGDVMAQEIEYRRGVANAQRYDWHRIGRMFIVGALQGPLHHYVYNWMDRVMPVATFKNVIKKILIDELVMSPACLIIFFYSACFLENKTIKETNDELKEKFLFIYFIDWLLWPGAQYINFRYLETKYRVTFVNVCTALYNIFMSYMKHDYNVDL